MVRAGAGTDLGQHVHPVHPGHDEIEKDQAGLVLCEGGHGRPPVLSTNELVAERGEPPLKQGKIVRFVIDKEQSLPRSSGISMDFRSRRPFRFARGLAAGEEEASPRRKPT